jgi:three-Cys-motif partner protein
MFLCQETPAEYEGRSHVYVKHQLLKCYLERLLHIVGASANKLNYPEIKYVDFFAGPWIKEKQTINSTSIKVAIDELERAKRQLGTRTTARFSALFIEKDPDVFQQLSAYLVEQEKLTGLKLEALHGSFPECVPEVLKQCRSEAFCFFFIDPFGYKDVGPAEFKELIQRPRSELLINLMVDHINRFKRKDDPALQA